MKKTFSNIFLNWTLIIITLIAAIDFTYRLFTPIQFYSTFLLKVVFAFASVFAFISLMVKRSGAERNARFFIIIVLLVPQLFVWNQFLSDLLFYSINRINLLKNPFLFLSFVTGIVLLALSIKYSAEIKSVRIKDYGLLIMLFGIFNIIMILVEVVETHFIAELNKKSYWEIIIKILLGLCIIYFGFRLKNEKMRLKSCLSLSVTLIFLYGII
jgi:hypothetical protein